MGPFVQYLIPLTQRFRTSESLTWLLLNLSDWRITQRMKALIIDDEEKAREILELMLKLHAPEIGEIRLAAGGHFATEMLAEYQPDLVFLDIKMPGLSGFDWLASLQDRPFDVIFTTAYDQYAIQAIRFSAFDYLLKPVDPEDLRDAVQRYISEPHHRRKAYDNLLFNIAQKDPSHLRLTVATTERKHYLDPQKIIRCEADGNYTHFYLENDKHVMASRPLGHYGSLLPESLFIRCHKSHIVNRTFIEAITDKKIHLNDGSIVEVSRRRMASVKSSLA